MYFLFILFFGLSLKIILPKIFKYIDVFQKSAIKSDLEFKHMENQIKESVCSKCKSTNIVLELKTKKSYQFFLCIFIMLHLGLVSRLWLVGYSSFEKKDYGIIKKWYIECIDCQQKDLFEVSCNNMNKKLWQMLMFIILFYLFCVFILAC